VSNPTIKGPDGKPLGTIERAFNRTEHHDLLVQAYEPYINAVAEAGFKNLICFSGNRDGMDDETGLKNCAAGLKRLMPLCEKKGVTLVMELLNSKVNHKDYMCDLSSWGEELCKAIGSDHFKLLYDIYHMQIMEGDLARTIEANLARIPYMQLVDNPGRNEPGTGEINYPFLFEHIDRIGYKGWIGCEYKPKTTTDAGLGWARPYLAA